MKDLAHASSLCGACADACPVRIDIPRMLIELRERSTSAASPRGRSVSSSARSAACCSGPRSIGSRRRVGRLFQRPFARGGVIHRLPLVFGEWTRTRDLPPIASRTFQERWADLEREARR